MRPATRAARRRRRVHLPVPAPFDDERVLAAFGPIANLACQRTDPPDTTRRLDASRCPRSSSAASQRHRPYRWRSASESTADDRASFAPLARRSRLAGRCKARTRRGRTHALRRDRRRRSCPALLQFTFNRLQTGEPQSLCQFQGKVLLIVNTASYCGNTPPVRRARGAVPQVQGSRSRRRRLPVERFRRPGAGLEPGDRRSSAALTYGVQFPMFEKSTVTNVGANPLFAA